jgi:hypothetical protein
MTITQPEDKTLTKERIEAILILANHLDDEMASEDKTDTLVQWMNTFPSLKGNFTLSEKGEIVFVAH